MAKTCLGIDIGKDQLKLVLMKGENIHKVVSVQMPEGLLKEGRIVSVETTGELIRKTMKENKIHSKEAAVVISSGICFLRNVTMPEMTAEQLVYNLPYEFRDYITDELKKYAFDYSVNSDQGVVPLKSSHKKQEKKKGKSKETLESEEAPEEHREMELLAAAVPIEAIEELRLMLRKAGLRLTMAAPEVSACEALLYRKLKNEPDKEKEYGILDLGSTSSRLLIFKGCHHQVTRVIERGMEQVEELLADYFHIDIHLAHTWLLANHENCVDSDVCRDAFSQISVELMRALNFYQFSNPDSRLDDIWICGGGASIPAMRESLTENLQINIHDARELVEGMTGNQETADNSLSMMAAGIALSKTMRDSHKRINLAQAGQKKNHYLVAIPAGAAIIAAAGVLGKVSVADRLIEVSSQQSISSGLQKQVEDITAYIDSFGDLQDTYAHYTYQGMTTDELGYTNRPEVLKLLKDVIFPKVVVSSWSVSGNQLTLPVTGTTLADINKLIQELDQEKIVDYCTVTTAVADDTEEKGETVTGQITIYLNNLSAIAGESGEADGAATGVTDENAETAGGTTDETAAGEAADAAVSAVTDAATDTAAGAARDTAAGAARDTAADAAADTATDAVTDAATDTAGGNE